MTRAPIPTWFFVLVVVRLGDRFLVVHETKHGQLWYLPAGRVEPGETFAEAAARETLEEAGIRIALEGVVRVEHRPYHDGTTRVRVVFLARPEGDPTPKHVPDEESLEARWVTLAELDGLPLRGDELDGLFRFVAGGGAIHPVEVLGTVNDLVASCPRGS